MKIRDLIKKIVNRFVPQAAFNQFIKNRDKKQLAEWKKNGCPVPPPHIVKQIAIEEYRNKYGYTTLIETGTYLGEMVEAQKTRFKNVISIELAADLFKKAQKRFINDKNVHIIQGDSGKVLVNLLNNIKEPAIFWLDGHYSEGITAKGAKACPIFEELDAIFKSDQFNHILLIDDAKDFTGNEDYPSIEEITKFIKSKNNKYQVEVKHNIIRCVI